MGSIYLIGAIIFGTLGVLAVFAGNDPESAPWWMSWAAWLLFVPAFTLLFFAFETFGIARAYALWAGGTALLVMAQGTRWGDKLSTNQLASIGLIIVGLIIFGLG